MTELLVRDLSRTSITPKLCSHFLLCICPLYFVPTFLFSSPLTHPPPPQFILLFQRGGQDEWIFGLTVAPSTYEVLVVSSVLPIVSLCHVMHQGGAPLPSVEVTFW